MLGLLFRFNINWKSLTNSLSCKFFSGIRRISVYVGIHMYHHFYITFCPIRIILNTLYICQYENCLKKKWRKQNSFYLLIAAWQVIMKFSFCWKRNIQNLEETFALEEWSSGLLIEGRTTAKVSLKQRIEIWFRNYPSLTKF